MGMFDFLQAEERDNYVEQTKPVAQRAQEFDQQKTQAPAAQQSRPSGSMSQSLRSILQNYDPESQSRIYKSFNQGGPGIGGLLSGISASIGGRDPGPVMNQLQDQRRQSLEDVLGLDKQARKESLENVDLQGKLDEAQRLESTSGAEYEALADLFREVGGNIDPTNPLQVQSLERIVGPRLQLQKIREQKDKDKKASRDLTATKEALKITNPTLAAQIDAAPDLDSLKVILSAGNADRRMDVTDNSMVLPGGGKAYDPGSAKKWRDGMARVNAFAGIVADLEPIFQQVTANGFEALSPETRAASQSLVNQALFQIAALNDQGALQAPDKAVAEQIVGDPTKLLQLDSQAMAKLRQLQRIAERTKANLDYSYREGAPAPSYGSSSPTAPAPAAGGRTPEQVREEMRAGKISREQARKELESMNYGR